MSSSLLDSLTGLITPDLVSKAAAYFGDSEGTVSKGIGAVLPLVLGGVASKASDQGFANGLFDLVSNPANDGSVLNNVAGLLSPGAASSPLGSLGGRLLGSVFGDNLGSVGSALSGFAGGKPATANSLLSFAAPLVLAVLGKAVRGGGLNVSSLANLLLGQKSAITGALPGPLANLDRFVSTPARVAAAPPPAEVSRPSIWRWLLPLLIALLAIWLLSKVFGHREAPVEQTPPPAAAEPAPQPAPVEPTPADTGPVMGAPSADAVLRRRQRRPPGGFDRRSRAHRRVSQGQSVDDGRGVGVSRSVGRCGRQRGARQESRARGAERARRRRHRGGADQPRETGRDDRVGFGRRRATRRGHRPLTRVAR